MAGRVLQTDFKRIGRSGPTTDGRVIDPAWIDEMAESYNKEIFTALIWPDHMRFQNYGTVDALRATDNDEGGRDLWAILSPNAFYQADNRFGQRLFTSMEISFDFRKSGKAYLTGLGALDDPGSVATTEIRFSKNNTQQFGAVTPFIEAHTQTFEDQAPNSLLDQIKALFKNQPTEDNDMADKQALEALKTEVAEIKAMFAKLAKDNGGDDENTDETPDPTAAAFAKLNARLDELEAKFSKTPAASSGDGTTTVLVAELTEKFSALETKLNQALTEQPGTEGGEHFGAGDETASLYI
jgi:hypothetical protein